ncbi:hypothetical protein CDAR_602201 [Caerostris darwini]|uniref:Uncharacterized protein n=1 Tax=Caerostris darwini TaxID=1538125 RepID=A0AAV4N9F0_9ARAC|nr:hypothetical protein CDAR_602201 [Caerostris darwini]
MKGAILKASRAQLLGKYPIFNWHQPRREGLPLPTVAVMEKRARRDNATRLDWNAQGFYQSVATTLCRGIFLISFFPFSPPVWSGQVIFFPCLSLLLGGFDSLLLTRFGRLIAFPVLGVKK